jgi:hypothetical protein
MLHEHSSNSAIRKTGCEDNTQNIVLTLVQPRFKLELSIVMNYHGTNFEHVKEKPPPLF